MAGIFSVVRSAGFTSMHSSGVVSALLFVSTSVALFGGLWIWLSHLASGEQTTPAMSSLTTGPNDSPSAAHVPVGVKVGIADQVSGDRELSLTS